MRALLLISLAASVLLRTSELSLQTDEVGEGWSNSLGSDVENPMDELSRKLHGLVDKKTRERKSYFGSGSTSGIDVTPESLPIENTREEELDRKLQRLVDRAKTKVGSGSAAGVDTLDADSAYPTSADLDMDAYVIAKPALFDHMKDMLVQLGFRPQRVDPVELKNASCNGASTYAKAVHGIFLAHQSVWSKIKESGKSAFVLESDATPGDAPISELKQRLKIAAADVNSYTHTPRYIAAGHCGQLCTTAYFMNVKAADVGTHYEFCSFDSKEPAKSDSSAAMPYPDVDQYLTHVMCMQAQCTWEDGLPGVHRCADCYGEGLFFQNRKLHGVHGIGKTVRNIKAGETRDTFMMAQMMMALL
jgi:hypothetical protein